MAFITKSLSVPSAMFKALKHGVVLIFFPTKNGKHVSYFFAVMEHRLPMETSVFGIFFSQVKVDIKRLK